METPQQPTPKSPEEPKEEKLEFLRREEVRTLAKDTAKAREEDAKKERERIASLRDMSRRDTSLQKEMQAPKQPEIVLSQQPSQGTKEDSVQPAGPVLPKRSLGHRQKLFTRLVVVGLIVFVVSNAVIFGYFYFFKQGGESQLKPTPTPPVTQEPTPEPVPVEPTPVPPPSPIAFFEAPQQEILLGNTKELLQELKTLLTTSLDPGFLNIVVKTQLDILSTQQFLERSNITMPEALNEKLGENLMLFSYVTEQKKRLGFLVKLKETEGVSELLQSWEQSLQQDTAAFFDIIGKKGNAYTPFFRSALYQSIPVRFQTFSVIDFGIVYGIVQDKLLLTSSFESFQKAVDQLKEI